MHDHQDISPFEDTRVTDEGGRDDAPLPVDTQVGRYVVRELIGVGGMGRVYRAYDPKLGRDVALKLVRDRGRSLDLDRMRREAMAMAQLSHPNVLPIYDVDDFRGLPFFVMELVHGQTLRQWARAQPWDWPGVLRVFLAAGRGLAAAHDAGFVHRDFKPANVMVGDDGRVRVMDFGLARAHGLQEPSVPDSQPAARSGLRDMELTDADTVVGTPAYMAPEQLCGERVGPAADQYAFCVSLWEVATGRRPFTDGRWSERSLPPAEPEAPPWSRAVQALLVQGLAPKVEDRHASMQVLLAELSRTGQPRARGRWIAGGVGVLAAVAGLSALVLASRAAPCPDVDALRQEVWGAAASERVEQAMLASGAAHAPATWERLRPVLDDYAQRWAQQRHAACQAIAEAEEEATVDARIECLQQRRRALAALVTTLEEADASVVTRAFDAGAGLPAVDACEDPQHLADAPPPPASSQVAAAEDLRERMAQVRALHQAGRHASTEDSARALVKEAEALGYAPLTIDAWITLGNGLGHESSADAVEPLEKAYFEAVDLGLDRRAALAANTLAQTLGVGLGRYEDALRWAEHARVVAERVGDPQLRRRYHVVLGNIHDAADDYPKCVESRERALQMARESLGPESFAAAREEVALGGPLARLSRNEEAEAIIEHALPILERELGPQHPQLGRAINLLGQVQRLQGKFDAAQDSFERTMSIYEAVEGEASVRVAEVLVNFGTIAYARRDHDGAQRYFERALGIFEQRLGPEHYRLSALLLNLAVIDRQKGRHAQALERLGRARGMVEEHFGPEHPQVWVILNNTGNLHQSLGDYAKAEQVHGEALALGERMRGPESDEAATSLVHLGNIKSLQGQHAEAVEMLARAVEVLTRVQGPEHLQVANATELFGYALRGQGDHAAALPRLERVVQMREAMVGEEHPQTHYARAQVGITLLDLGRTGDALGQLEPAWGWMREHDSAEPREAATVAFALARALHHRAAQRERALRLARTARQRLGTEAFGEQVLRAEIGRWLDEHDPS